MVWNLDNLVLLADFQLPLKDPVIIFSLVLFIILLAPIVLRKFGIPSIIGLIIAGMAIGDNGFQIIEKSSIDLFGKAGLLYIMFLAGLELDMTEFKKNRNRSLVFGTFTFAIPLIVGFIIFHYVLNFSLMASLLVSSMFATHTLVAYPLASRLGITKNEAVTVTVGGTIITDTAVLIILAVITGAAEGMLDQAFWLKLGLSLVIFTFVVLWIFPIIGRWFFKKIKDDKTSHFIFVLAMVFLAGFLAELAGVEAIIGAFLAGLSLNQLIPHASSLMNRIEFVGNAIFIPFFLITVGMLVDLRVILNGPEALTIAAVLTGVAVATKWLAAFISQKFFGFTSTQRNVMFGLSSAHAAATIAVILIGYNMKIIDENVLNGTVVLILVTCMIGSFVTANAGRKLAIQEAELDILPVNTNDIFMVPILKEEEMEDLIDFSLLIHDQKNTTPIYSLAVVEDDEEAKDKVKRSTVMLEKAVAHAAASEANLQMVARIDLNLSNGIARAVKELMVTDLVLSWPEKPSTTDRLFGTLFGTHLNNIITSVQETIYVCRLIEPINVIKKIVIAIPQNAEFEIGFGHWVFKVSRLAKQAGAKMVVYSSTKTLQAFMKTMERFKGITDISHKEFEGMEDFLVLAREVSADDMIIAVMARKGSLSYDSAMENVGAKVNRHFTINNTILIYPEQQLEGGIIEPGLRSEDITLAPIEEQLENLNKIGKVVKRIFVGKPPKK